MLGRDVLTTNISCTDMKPQVCWQVKLGFCFKQSDLYQQRRLLLVMSLLSLTFEPGSWFEQGLFQGAVQMKVKSLVFCNIVPHSRKQHQVVKSLGHSLFKIGWEDSTRKGKEKIIFFTRHVVVDKAFQWEVHPSRSDGSPCCLVHCSCSPCLWFCQIQNLLPVWKCWDYFKCLGQFATAVFWQNLMQNHRKKKHWSNRSYSELLEDLYSEWKVSREFKNEKILSQRCGHENRCIQKNFCARLSPCQPLCTPLSPLGPVGAWDTPTPLTLLFRPQSAFP